MTSRKTANSHFTVNFTMRILILMVIANSVIVHSTQAYVVISTKIKRHQIIESSIKNRRICRFLQKHENTDSASNTLGLRRKVHEYQLKQQPSNQIPFAVFSNAWKVIVFSGLIYLCGAFLGPFLDSYHSSFGVLKYDNPIVISTIPLLEGTIDHPALTTAWWVPELFGLAGITIGWLYVILDASFTPIDDARRQPSAPIILYGIGFFAFQYWLSGFLFSGGCAENVILSVMGTLAGFGFILFDNTKAGTIASLATCVGGPLIEALLLSVLGHDDGYRYADPGWTGLFPIWIVPGGPAVGNLGRGIWNALTDRDIQLHMTASDSGNESLICQVCRNTRATECPNCLGEGYYITYGKRARCNCCKGRGLVMCRSCFSNYGDDPYDLDRVREIMSGLAE